MMLLLLLLPFLVPVLKLLLFLPLRILVKHYRLRLAITACALRK
jgi:hypothetical protein